MFEDKYANSESILWLWRKINSLFVRKNGNKVLSDNNYSDAEKQKLSGIEQNANNYTLPKASSNTLGGIRIGSGLEIDEHGIVTTVVNPGATMRWNQITNTPSTLAGYGITDGATKTELQQVIEQVSQAFKYKGSVNTYADLLLIVDPQTGDVWNVIDTGKNYAWSGTEWDDLGGLADLSNYWSKDDLVALTRLDIDEITGSASTVEAFLAILASSNEVMLDENLNFAEPITIDKNFTIDLNGKRIQSVINNSLFDVDGGTLTIKGTGTVDTVNSIASAVNGGKIVISNGTFNSDAVGFTVTGVGSKITFNGGALEAGTGGIGAVDGAEILINGGQIEADDNYVLFTNKTSGRGNNTITINGGRLIANVNTTGHESVGVYIANDDSFLMNDGEIVANDGVGICMRAGTVVINDGTITATGQAGTTGVIGDDNTPMTKSAIIYHESANFPGKQGINLTIAGGTITGVDHSVHVLSNEATPNVTVTGGVFSPAYPEE